MSFVSEITEMYGVSVMSEDLRPPLRGRLRQIKSEFQVVAPAALKPVNSGKLNDVAGLVVDADRVKLSLCSRRSPTRPSSLGGVVRQTLALAEGSN
jgi:hypothetical protein